MKFTHKFKTTLPHVAMTTAYDVDLRPSHQRDKWDTSIGIDPDHHYGGW